MGFLKKIKRNKVYKFFENNIKYRRALYVTFFTLMVVALISGSMIPNVLDLAEGDVSPVTIEADRYLTFIDEEATEIKKAEIAAKVKTVYRLEPTVVDEYEAQLENITDKIKQILNDKELLLNQKVNILSGLGFNFTLIDVETLSAASESQIDALVGRLEVIIKNNFVAGVNSETLIFTIEKINSDISLLDINPVYKKFISNLANTLKMV
ncbi:MAG: hypothetical protein PHH19_03670, partial [Eubacteriales bacterium]|nr:hypothetical protein [Eubacteriales bacterium]